MTTEQRLIIGNSLDVLKTLEDSTIDVCVTSPPYWSLRDYQSEPVVWGGEPSCEHEWEDVNGEMYCKKCGAWKGQLGLEPDPMDYVRHLSDIFDEVRRVLKPTGACWVNLGDTYATVSDSGLKEDRKSRDVVKDTMDEVADLRKNLKGFGYRQKSLMQIPSRFAIEMCDRGWILRNKLIWHKPNAMPSPVKDRFTVDYEEFFFFTKEPQYFFNQIKEPMKQPEAVSSFGSKKTGNNNSQYSSNHYDAKRLNGKRNVRCVWSIPTQPSSEEHCAMFPPKLIETPIQACCPEGGTVLDPFCGSGTTLEYCRLHDINGIGIEINPKFKDIIKRRSMMDIAKMEAFL